ncbi:hypothetical protein BJ138DRAFT_1225772 [Hygrophoropsis aurantiaca]|uniref:Uncharacterized protein n=1 Tax=Hygrophoropsis aurantiaca TaxID=72124 RepID=A0ACB7ZYE0_9AGAM|nr:hypothetical protein BJ138DRAFT_1225772 [Hygrophoropsis aurantiaca]
MATWIGTSVHCGRRRAWMQFTQLTPVQLSPLSGLSSRSPASLATERIPYPTSAPNPDIFEPIDGHYINTTTTTAAPTSADTLVSLVSGRQFAAATALRDEMLAHAIPIPLHPVYEHAAAHAVRNNTATELAAWFALLPPASTHWSPLTDIRTALFSATTLDLRLVLRFGLLCAEKGYVKGQLAMQTLAAVFRYAHPRVARAFLGEYERRVGEQLGANYWTGVYSLALRTQLLAGRVDEAVRVLEMARGRGHQVHPFTLALLRDRAGDPGLEEEAESNLTSSPATLASVSPSLITTPSSPPSLAAQLRTLKRTIASPTPPSAHALLAFMLAYRARQHTSNRTDANISRININHANPITHTHTGASTHTRAPPNQDRAIMMLRRRAYGYATADMRRARAAVRAETDPTASASSPIASPTIESPGTYAPAALFALAEMLYHRTHAAPTRLLAVFARTFVPVGVPGRSVRAILRRERQRQAHAKGHHVSQATGHADQAHPAQVTAHPARVTNLQQREPKIQQGGLTPSPHANLLPPAPLPLKLWPGPAHTALVWEAVVWGTHPRGVGSLYAALVRGVSGDEGLRGASPSGSRTSGGATSSERGALAQGEEDGQQGEEWEWEDVESHLNTASDAGGKGKGRSGLEVPRHTYDAAHFSPFVKAFAKRPWVYANVPSAVGSVDASSAPYNGASSTDASSSDLPSAPGPDTPSAPGPDTPSAPGRPRPKRDPRAARPRGHARARDRAGRAPVEHGAARAGGVWGCPRGFAAW